MIYAVLASIMHGLRPLFIRGRWEIHCIMSGVCTSLILLAQYLMITFRRGSILFTPEAWWQIGGPGVIAAIMAPLLFWFLHTIGEATGNPFLAGTGELLMNRRRQILSPRIRIQVLGLFMLLGLGAVVTRLWWVQVAHGPEWTAKIRGSSEVTVRIPSIRGEIRDRNGVTLGAEPRQLRSRFLFARNGEGLSLARRSAADRSNTWPRSAACRRR